MTPYEILLSESQERMLVVAKVGEEEEVRRILEKWELEAEVIGRVTADGNFRILEHGKVVADIPARPLTDSCPTYEREGIEGDEVQAQRGRDLSEFAAKTGDMTDDFLRLLDSPNIGSKRWIHEQFDTTVRTGSVIQPGGDAGAVRIRGTRKAIAATTDCNGRYAYLHPRRGAMIAVAEAARNLACVGATPTAVTNNLNFGSPLKPHIYFQLREAVIGMADACRTFETPVTGGNVSLFNETEGQAIYPTPVVGMVGIVEDVDHLTGHAFQSEGDAIVLLGVSADELGGSEYLYALHDLVAGEPPQVDLLAERSLQQGVLAMIRQGLVRSAHDCAEGGIACALAESALSRDPDHAFGVDVTLDDALPAPSLLFGESQGRILVSCAPGDVAALLDIAETHGIPAKKIGTVGAPRGMFTIATSDARIESEMSRVAEQFFGGIERRMDDSTLQVHDSNPES